MVGQEFFNLLYGKGERMNLGFGIKLYMVFHCDDAVDVAQVYSYEFSI